MIQECEACGEDNIEYLVRLGDYYLCSVHMCQECKEPGYARDGGAIYCDTCYLSGEGRECERCSAIEHLDQMVGNICQRCDDQAGFYGGI